MSSKKLLNLSFDAGIQEDTGLKKVITFKSVHVTSEDNAYVMYTEDTLDLKGEVFVKGKDLKKREITDSETLEKFKNLIISIISEK